MNGESIDFALLGKGGIVIALLGIIYKLGKFALEKANVFVTKWMEGEKEIRSAHIEAIKGLTVTVKEHTTIDVESHEKMTSGLREVVETLARIDGKMEGAANERARTGLTPIHGVPIPRNPHVFAADDEQSAGAAEPRRPPARRARTEPNTHSEIYGIPGKKKPGG